MPVVTNQPPRSFPCWPAPALVALATGLTVLAAIDPAGSYPRAPQGPGLTVDERFNVEEGVRLVVGLRVVAAGDIGLTELFDDDNPPAVRELIGNHLADHPPLGRVWIGAFHEIAKKAAPPHEPAGPFVVACARAAPAAAFALTVFLAGWTAGRWYGAAAGVIASVSLALMPRVFGHAHLASLETFIGLTYAATILSVATWAVRTARAPTLTAAALTGVVFGLALLTKIQAVFLPVAVAAWALWQWRHRAILPLAVWGAVGLVTLLAGWPWLWIDPAGHLAEYLGRAAARAPVNVWYFGRQYADTAVPWHYPFVLFLATVPPGFQLLAVCGVACRARRAAETSAREQLLLLAIAVPLVAFAWPGVAVYDGVRLFLVVFPLWAVFIGRGGSVVLDWLKQRFRAGLAPAAMTLFVLLQAIGLVLVHPAYLSYYSLLVGGLPGARALGFELSYWGDSLTRELLRAAAGRVPEGSTIDVTPVLEPHQLDFLREQSPILRARRIRLRAFEDRFLESGETKHLLYFHRHADISPQFRDGPAGGRLLAEVRRQGVQLAALYAFDRAHVATGGPAFSGEPPVHRIIFSR